MPPKTKYFNAASADRALRFSKAVKNIERQTKQFQRKKDQQKVLRY